MRLTLRTLLAYMDGLLDAKDSQEIGKKIEESKFASELFHKIRDVMRRLRLGAPSVTERAANLDCNTVAEYLDNVLPGDRVPDFEEVSLKSEMHLAEVASCHQILTMVLGEPAEIDPKSRERMYQLPIIANRVDEERQAAVDAATMLSGDGNGPVPPSAPVKVRPRPVVPEYLRDQPKKSRLLPAAAIMILAGAAIGLLLLMLGQFNPGTPLGNALQWVQAKMHGKAADDEDRDDSNIKRVGGPLGGESAKSSGDTLTGTSGTADAAAPRSSDSAAAAPSDTGKMDVPGPSLEKPPLDKPPLDKPSGKPLPETPGPAIPGSSAPEISSTGVATVGTLSPAGSAMTPLRPVPSVAGPGVQPEPLPVGPAMAIPPAKSPVQVASIDPTAGPKPGDLPPALGPGGPPPAPEDKAKIGHFMSDGQDVLLKLEPSNAGWRRVLPEEFLGSHQQLLALPSYRLRVVILNADVSLELVNGTRIELLPNNAQGQPSVDIDFGRMVVKPFVPQTGAKLRVVVGSHAGTITLTTADAIAGLEVTRLHDAGTDPEKVLSHALTRLYVARGSATWDEGEGKQPVRLAAPAVLMLDGNAADTPPDAEQDLPKWLTASTVNELDQRAAVTVSQALPSDRAASLGLMELTEDHRTEVHGLAARCLGYMGQFDPMTVALNDERFRTKWPEYYDQLKEAIARGPETAAAVRQSLEKQYGNDSAALYRMLWGFTNKDLDEVADAQLVKFLDHEEMVFRVLAIENLNDITNKRLFYKADDKPPKRLASVQRWRKDELESGQIRFKVREAKPVTPPVEPPAKGTTPEPPRPMDVGAPGEVKPASAVETIPSQPGAGKAAPAERFPASDPVPDPRESRPRVAYPEPAGNGS